MADETPKTENASPAPAGVAAPAAVTPPKPATAPTPPKPPATPAVAKPAPVVAAQPEAEHPDFPSPDTLAGRRGFSPM